MLQYDVSPFNYILKRREGRDISVSVHIFVPGSAEMNEL